MRKKFFLKTAIATIIGVLYGSSAGPVIDENTIVAAHAANFAYNITVNADGHVVIPVGLEGWEVIGDPHLAGGDNNIQAIALKRWNETTKAWEVIISYRGTTRPEDWMANLGIGYAQSCIIKEPIIQHLLTGFMPALTYHGLKDPAAALTYIFGSSAPTIGYSLGWGASVFTPFNSAYRGGKNAVHTIHKGIDGIHDGIDRTAQLLEDQTGLSQKISDSAQAIEDTTGIKKETQATIAKIGGALAMPFAFGTKLVSKVVEVGVEVGVGITAASLNAGRHALRTAVGIVQDGVQYGGINGLLSGACTQRELIFDISRDHSHPYAAYLTEVANFEQSVMKEASKECPDGAVFMHTGHSLGAHLGACSFVMMASGDKGGSIQGFSSTTYARPNGFGGIYKTLLDMGVTAPQEDSWPRAFSDSKALEALNGTYVYSHEHDIVARIGDSSANLGTLRFLTAPVHGAYKEKGHQAIAIHHKMKGIIKTLTNSHIEDTDESDSKTNADTSLSLRSVSTGSNQVHDDLEDEDAEMLKRVEQSRQENLNMQAAIRNSVVPGKREADK